MAPSRRRYSSDYSRSEPSSEDEQRRRRRGRDNQKKAYSSSDESSDSERDREKVRRSKDDGRRRRHDSDDDETERKAVPRVLLREDRRSRDDHDKRRRKGYSSDESADSGRRLKDDDCRRRRHDSDDDETEQKAVPRVSSREDRRGRDDHDKRKKKGYSSDESADSGRRLKDECGRRRHDSDDDEVERRRRLDDRRDHARQNSDEELDDEKDRRERTRKDEEVREGRVRRNADKEIGEQRDRRETSQRDEEVRGEIAQSDREQSPERARRNSHDELDNKKDWRERSQKDEKDREGHARRNASKKLNRSQKDAGREHSKREEDDSMEEGELVDKKDEIMKKREKQQRVGSPDRKERHQEGRRQRDFDITKSRDKGRDSDEEDNKKVDRAKKRDRESSPRRRDRNHRNHEDRRCRDGDDYDRRHKELVKSREKVIREESKKEEPVTVPQMPDAGVIKTGGIYIPPHRMAQMMREVQDKSSEQYQRLSWDALRKSINGLVNKVNATNVKNIIPELFSENLIRGRGLFCRSCMKSQMASPGFTDVFAALVAVVNTKFPEVGKLLLKRIVLQLRRAYKRNDKPQLLAATKFIAHLVNQQVAHEIIALELLTLLLEKPSDDSVEVAVGFVKECGALLQDFSPQGLHGIFERFRGILHEGEIDKRVQFLIEGLFAIRKAKFQGFPAIRPELDLVEQEDQFTHEVSLEDEIDPETSLDVFKLNPQFLEDEKAYEDLKKSILGDESSDDEEGSDAASEEDEDEEESEEDEEAMKIKDETETNLVNLRRTIYLTIMSSVDFEEAGHKLLKIKLEPGQEMELCIMLLECCSQERTYLRYYGLLGQRFCMINKVYQENFEKCFVQQYSMIHRLETNKLRNVAKFFAHLLGTSALPWHVLAYIRLTEEDTTSSSRIFIKILFQELSEHLGIRLLNERLNDPIMQDSFESIFPKDNPKNTRFAINFFTSIGLGGITESLREYLKNMPRLIMQQQKPVSESDDDSGSSSASSSGSSSSEADSSSESESDSSSDEHERRERHSKRRKRN